MNRILLWGIIGCCFLCVEKTLAVVEDAIDYLTFAQTEDGRFLYEHDFVLSRPSKGDNLVRQAGAGFGLGQALTWAGHHPHMKGVLAKAIAAYGKISKPHKTGALLCHKKTYCPLGATALALLSELYYFKESGDTTYAPHRENWMRGLLHLRWPEKGFHSSPKQAKESDYYNGEAWLALAMYHEMFSENQEVKNALKSLDTYLVAKYTQAPTLAFYHWGMMASEARYNITKDIRLLNFMVAQTRWMFQQRPWKPAADQNACYMVEGLNATYNVIHDMPQYKALTKKIVGRIRRELDRSAALQITKDQKSIALPKGAILTVPELSRFKGAFLNRRADPKVRIDTTQHCLSAFVRGEKILRDAA